MIARAIAYRFRPRVEHLILHVTSRCNLNCRTCFVRKAGVDLPIGTIREVARALRGLTWVDIGGGEPFLRDDLPEICALFALDELTIPTNGTLPERIEPILKRIRERFKGALTVGVSLDGFEQVNDDIRGRDSFRKALETVRRLVATEGVGVKVSTVVCRRNFGELLPFMRFVRSLGVQYHSLLLLRGEPADPTFDLPPLEDLDAAREEIFAVLQSYPYHPKRWAARISRNYHRLLWDYSMKALREKRQPVPCLAGRAHLVIYADGDVAPCELLPAVGNLFESSLEDIRTGPRMRAAVERVRRGECACTHNCNMVENILFHWRTYPALLGIAGHG